MSGIEGLLLRLTLLSQASAQEKILSLLSHLAQTVGVGEKEGTRIPFALSHKDIASWVGTTRETASLQMGILVKKQRIFYRGRTLYVSSLLR